MLYKPLRTRGAAFLRPEIPRRYDLLVDNWLKTTDSKSAIERICDIILLTD